MTTRTTPEQHADFFHLHKAGYTYREIAERHNVHEETVRYWTGRLESRAKAQLKERRPRRKGALKSLATPIHFSATSVSYERHAPLLGEQTDQILAELGYAPKAIAELRARQVI